MSDLLRIVLADDSYLLREGVRALLEDSDEVEICAAVSNATELLDAVARFEPDAVLTDIRMPPTLQTEGIEAAHEIRRRFPKVGVVVLSQHADESYVRALLEHGTDGLAYLLKERVGDVDELLRALHEVCAGRTVLDPRVLDALITRRMNQEPAGLETLTEREHDVLREMARGLSNTGIATSLVLSESAVEKHIGSIFAKLGQHDLSGTNRRVSAVLAYLGATPELS
ncbi:MAG: response regulator transcription factor [Aeromicrobium sp.]